MRSNFDRDFDRIFGFAIVGWVIGAVAYLTFLGVIIWGIITLVKHFTG